MPGDNPLQERGCPMRLAKKPLFQARWFENSRRRAVLTVLALVVVALLAVTQASISAGKTSPIWPMYQHDAARTGQSQFLGITSPPKVLWQMRLPVDSPDDPVNGISAGPDGTLYVLFCGQLFAVDSQAGTIKWQYTMPGEGSAAPALGGNDLIYQGHGSTFYAFTDTGEVAWQGDIGGWTTPFRSSPAIGQDGNIYFVRDGMWSLTPDGYLRWIYPFSWFAGEEPAIGPDGTIYGWSYDSVLYAVRPDGSLKWASYSMGPTGLSANMDGTLYVGSQGSTNLTFRVYALNLDGTQKWMFEASGLQGSSNDVVMVKDISIGPDGTLYFIPAVTTNMSVSTWSPQLYALNPDGTLKWKKVFPALQERVIWFPPPVVDRANHITVCVPPGTCYGLEGEGNILWEYSPLFEGEINPVYTAPVITSDGKMYLLNAAGVIQALVDPAIVPWLSTIPESIALQTEHPSGTLTSTLQISSTAYPITWTAELLPPVDWVTLPITRGVTPETLEVTVLLDHLERRNFPYQATIQLSSEGGAAVNEPLSVQLSIFVGSRAYLPIIGK